MAANESAAGPKGNTYAVVIGISIYLDTDIAALQFSNRDAVFFADFLMSESGGSVPKKNIKLLIYHPIINQMAMKSKMIKLYLMT